MSRHEDLEYFVNMISEKKLNEIRSLLTNKEISSQSSIFDLKSKIDLESTQLSVLKKILDAFSSTDDLNICLDYLNQLKKISSQNEDNTQLVWTGPLIYNQNADNTSRVMIEMIDSSSTSITVVGYLIQSGTKEIFQSLKSASQRGVRIRFIFNHAESFFQKIEKLWKDDNLPVIYTYKPKNVDTSLHAKVLIVDSRDILVTSANLTNYGINENIELGIRYKGKLANDAEKLFDSLIQKKYLVVINGHR